MASSRWSLLLSPLVKSDNKEREGTCLNIYLYITTGTLCFAGGVRLSFSYLRRLLNCGECVVQVELLDVRIAYMNTNSITPIIIQSCVVYFPYTRVAWESLHWLILQIKSLSEKANQISKKKKGKTIIIKN